MAAMTTTFIRLLSAQDKADALARAVASIRDGKPEEGTVFSVVRQGLATADDFRPKAGCDERTRLEGRPAEVWRELSLMGHRIRDAVILRWADRRGQSQLDAR